MLRTGNLIDVILDWIYPPRCAICTEHMPPYILQPLCIECSALLFPLNWGKNDDHPILNHLAGRVKVESAFALYAFLPEGSIQKLVHRIKYGGYHHLATHLGCQIGTAISDDIRFEDIDVIIPVPIHWRRYLRRGFNQSRKIGEGVSKIKNIPLDDHSLKRKKYTVTQTDKSRWERMSSLESTIIASDSIKQYRHILLVDDVITTGSTIEQCVIAIHNVCDVRVSVAVAGIGGL